MRRDTHPKAKRWLAACLAVCLLGLGCSGDGDDQSSVPDGTSDRRLTGIWGGYFPGSSFESPDHGIEIDFTSAPRNGVLHRAAFLVRAGRAANRHDLRVEENGDQVTLTFKPGSADQSVFTGSFVDDRTLRGTFTNPSRGESFGLDVVHESSIPLGTIRRVSLTQSQTSALSGNANTLQISFRTEYEGTSLRSHTIYLGLGSPWAEWEDTGACCIGGSAYYGPLNDGFVRWRTLAFYPEWLYVPFRQSDSPVELPSAGFEIYWSDLIKRDGSKVSDAWAEENDVDPTFGDRTAEIKDLTLTYVETEKQYDADDLAVPFASPGTRSVVVDGNVYQVPGNTINLLRYLNFVVPFQQ